MIGGIDTWRVKQLQIWQIERAGWCFSNCALFEIYAEDLSSIMYSVQLCAFWSADDLSLLKHATLW